MHLYTSCTIQRVPGILLVVGLLQLTACGGYESAEGATGGGTASNANNSPHTTAQLPSRDCFLLTDERQLASLGLTMEQQQSIELLQRRMRGEDVSNTPDTPRHAGGSDEISNEIASGNMAVGSKAPSARDAGSQQIDRSTTSSGTRGEHSTSPSGTMDRNDATAEQGNDTSRLGVFDPFKRSTLSVSTLSPSDKDELMRGALSSLTREQLDEWEELCASRHASK